MLSSLPGTLRSTEATERFSDAEKSMTGTLTRPWPSSPGRSRAWVLAHIPWVLRLSPAEAERKPKCCTTTSGLPRTRPTSMLSWLASKNSHDLVDLAGWPDEALRTQRHSRRCRSRRLGARLGYLLAASRGLRAPRAGYSGWRGGVLRRFGPSESSYLRHQHDYYSQPLTSSFQFSVGLSLKKRANLFSSTPSGANESAAESRGLCNKKNRRRSDAFTVYNSAARPYSILPSAKRLMIKGREAPWKSYQSLGNTTLP